jgi:hypothetical protein
MGVWMDGQNYKAKWAVNDYVAEAVWRQLDRCDYSLWWPAEHGLHDAVNISTEQAPELIFTLLPGVDPGLLDKFVGRVRPP